MADTHCNDKRGTMPSLHYRDFQSSHDEWGPSHKPSVLVPRDTNKRLPSYALSHISYERQIEYLVVSVRLKSGGGYSRVSSSLHRHHLPSSVITRPKRCLPTPSTIRVLTPISDRHIGSAQLRDIYYQAPATSWKLPRARTETTWSSIHWPTVNTSRITANSPV
jgi:hypothetical protein